MPGSNFYGDSYDRVDDSLRKWRPFFNPPDVFLFYPDILSAFYHISGLTFRALLKCIRTGFWSAYFSSVKWNPALLTIYSTYILYVSVWVKKAFNTVPFDSFSLRSFRVQDLLFSIQRLSHIYCIICNMHMKSWTYIQLYTLHACEINCTVLYVQYTLYMYYKLYYKQPLCTEIFVWPELHIWAISLN